MQTMKGITEDCLEFHDVDRKVGVNLVPLSRVAFLPRVGELTTLPGSSPDDKGTYEVVEVHHIYYEDDGPREEGRAKTLKIVVNVKKENLARQ